MSPRSLAALGARAPAAKGIIGNGSFTTDWTGFQFQANSTNAVINELRFASSKTIRQSTIILASFNAVVGLVLAVGIFLDCYWAAKRADPQMRFRKSMYTIIGPMNIFPFILAIGIIVQGTITAVEQAKGMQGLLILGCLPISQVMLPTIFIVPYIQFVFGMETTVRAFRRRAFDGFGRWTVSVCVALVVVALAATYAVTRVVQPPNFCFASLFWFVQRYRVECFGLFTAISGSLLLGSLITFVRLYRSSTGSVIERIAASRMVYYMAIGAITNSIVVPFFASLTIRNDMEVSQLRGNLSMAAMVATNLTGLTNGGLYVFLRACQSSNIGRRGYLEMLDREKRRQLSRKQLIRKSPMTETYANQIEQPVSPPPRVYRAFSPGDEDAESLIAESQIGLAKTSSETASQRNYANGSPRKVAHVRKASYSVFPQQQSAPALNPKPLSILPAATYTPPTLLQRGPSAEVNDEDIQAMEIDIMRRDISSLLPPPRLVPGAFVPGHQRDSSMASSATVQIGLRLSNVNDMPRVGPPSFLQERLPTPRPTSSVYPKSMIVPAARPTLQQEEEEAVSPRGSVLIGSTVWLDPTKELPPAPLQPVKKDKGKGKERESQMLLSPLAYSPDGPGNSVTMASPSDKDARLSPATEKRPSEWI
ncbi:hypothetical protein ISF_03944 [Cordyceps fumosorosea ARSEF 2679]|uniref:Uncharacterized protein n=1 Tax=Cordyceps fumosorosea (strain ARSEF 2679) TaxID=1081104 RepID=A0A167YBA4_CORFA|nr:hypothetical protein ISF_03944 [Cordyceps fumosorosea ARSEF 2679]OAA66106.1 hypothetical protein ISF_03944 [Cordyceps fumosorosea ARSEF 2679]